MELFLVIVVMVEHGSYMMQTGFAGCNGTTGPVPSVRYFSGGGVGGSGYESKCSTWSLSKLQEVLQVVEKRSKGAGSGGVAGTVNTGGGGGAGGCCRWYIQLTLAQVELVDLV